MNHHNESDDKERKEHFIPASTASTSFTAIYGILHLVAFIFAIYLSFKCNGEFKIGSFLVACCCPWIYIIYILATTGGFCQGDVGTVTKPVSIEMKEL